VGYALGLTIGDVQGFRYRGASEHSVPGHVFVLHPDEVHDGRAGTSAGLRYKALYIEPRLIQDALGEGASPLPLVREAVSRNGLLAAAIMPALENLDLPIEDLQRDQIALELAHALAAVDASVTRKAFSVHHRRAVNSAREYLDGHFRTAVTSLELEAATGMTRYAIARHFRACLGTSPYRYLLIRRLDRVRARIRDGVPLVDAALQSGFADQSHMTRHFRKTYGLSPGRWAAIAR